MKRVNVRTRKKKCKFLPKDEGVKRFYANVAWLNARAPYNEIVFCLGLDGIHKALLQLALFTSSLS